MIIQSRYNSEALHTVDRESLRGANLRWLDLRGADLRGADLSGARLHSIDLAGADLRGANLSGTSLWKTSLAGADLQGANLQDASLTIVDLRGANLRNANLRQTRWLSRIFRQGQIQGADFTGADFRGARLGGYDLWTLAGYFTAGLALLLAYFAVSYFILHTRRTDHTLMHAAMFALSATVGVYLGQGMPYDLRRANVSGAT